MGLQLVSCSLFSVSHAVMRRARGVLHEEEYERFANAEAGKPTGVKSNEAWAMGVCLDGVLDFRNSGEGEPDQCDLCLKVGQ